jgi:hypothetical protein
MSTSRRVTARSSAFIAGRRFARKAAADALVVEHRDHNPTMPHGRSTQLADLVLGGLVIGGGAAGVDGDAFGHRKRCRMPRCPKRNSFWGVDDSPYTSLKPAEIRRRKSAISAGVLGRLPFPNWFGGVRKIW